MEWLEVDLQERTWTQPANKTKNGRSRGATAACSVVGKSTHSVFATEPLRAFLPSQLGFGKIFQVDHVVSCALNCSDNFIHLYLKSSGVPVLSVLDRKTLG